MTDIIIIGGGASGLTAAISAKETEPDAEVVIAERLSRVGKKILATGNGRCNLGNRDISPEHYHGSVDVMPVMSAVPDAERFFRDIGVLTWTDEQGRIYPYSNSAATVLNALRLRCEQTGVKEVCDFKAVDIIPENGRWCVAAEDGRELSCRRLIIASGGLADPGSGTDGSVLKLLRDMGYRASKYCPAVAPLKTEAALLKGLRGIRAKCRVQAFSGNELLRTEYGEIQFTETMLSGICVFNMAYLWRKYGMGLRLSVDLAPDISDLDLCTYLINVQKQRPLLPLSELLTGMFRKELAQYIIKSALKRFEPDQTGALTERDIMRVVKRIKGLEFPVTDCAPWKNAQSTCGGISAECITIGLQSRLHSGLWFCGETVDTVGDCGGFNLHWAWASGILAGRNAALSLKGGK